jgi:deazaflavin-dependent oxidoreductase (nitroreductase family)
MTEAKLAPNMPKWMVDHTNLYLSSGGKQGHLYTIQQPDRPALTVPSLLLTTTGRKSGQKFLFPLFYGKSGNSYFIVASKGGAPEHPGWYKNILANPEVEIQVATDKIKCRARTASGLPEEGAEPGDPGRRARSDQLTLMPSGPPHAVRKTGLKAVLALGISDTRDGVIVRTTRHMDPLLERQKSRKRNWPIITGVLDVMST